MLEKDASSSFLEKKWKIYIWLHTKSNCLNENVKTPGSAFPYGYLGVVSCDSFYFKDAMLAWRWFFWGVKSLFRVLPRCCAWTCGLIMVHKHHFLAFVFLTYSRGHPRESPYTHGKTTRTSGKNAHTRGKKSLHKQEESPHNSNPKQPGEKCLLLPMR